MTKPGYKTTEIGELPQEWKVFSFEEAFNKQEAKQSKIPVSKYKNKGKYPIIDQGSHLISGYTDNEELLYNGRFPLIIFGDHTLCVKYVDFQFAVGADGTKLLTPNNQRFSPKFLFYTIIGKDLKSEGYKRHFSILKRQFFQCPEINEQQKIAEILSTADETIQKVDEEITLTEKLKKGLMQTLLTKGIGHTKFKMTEIGEIPEEWKIDKVSNLKESMHYGITAKSTEQRSHLRFLRTTDISNFNFDPNDLHYCEITGTKPDLSKYYLKQGDIIVARAGTVGVSVLVKRDLPNTIFGSYLIKIAFNKDLIYANFVHYYFQWILLQKNPLVA